MRSDNDDEEEDNCNDNMITIIITIIIIVTISYFNFALVTSKKKMWGSVQTWSPAVRLSVVSISEF